MKLRFLSQKEREKECHNNAQPFNVQQKKGSRRKGTTITDGTSGEREREREKGWKGKRKRKKKRSRFKIRMEPDHKQNPVVEWDPNEY